MHEAYNNSENPIFESAVVLVDEIDNYLHPLVQARTIPVLIEFFPKVQFVFTSHAPVVLATLQKEQVKAYRIEDGKAIEISYFYGRTVQDILLDEYGINKRPSSKMQVRIEEMFRFISMGQQSQAKLIFDELLPILGEDDAAIQDAKHDLT
jgi:predicted ATP-binding protein involved in virulence